MNAADHATLDQLAADIDTCQAQVHLYSQDKVESTVYRCEREAGHGKCHWADKGGCGLTWSTP